MASYRRPHLERRQLMFTDEEKAQTAETYAEMFEAIERVDRDSSIITETPSLANVTPEDWERIYEREGDVIALLAVLKIMIQTAAQVLDNDALTSHVQATIVL
jgi:hypothetical protein